MTSSFAAPAFGTFGHSGRKTFIGSGVISADLSLSKDFKLSWEGPHLQLRSEMRNFPNYANFALPNQGRGNTVFCRISGLQAGTDAREIQMGLPYCFKCN